MQHGTKSRLISAAFRLEEREQRIEVCDRMPRSAARRRLHFSLHRPPLLCSALLVSSRLASPLARPAPPRVCPRGYCFSSGPRSHSYWVSSGDRIWLPRVLGAPLLLSRRPAPFRPPFPLTAQLFVLYAPLRTRTRTRAALRQSLSLLCVCAVAARFPLHFTSPLRDATRCGAMQRDAQRWRAPLSLARALRRRIEFRFVSFALSPIESDERSLLVVPIVQHNFYSSLNRSWSHTHTEQYRHSLTHTHCERRKADTSQMRIDRQYTFRFRATRRQFLRSAFDHLSFAPLLSAHWSALTLEHSNAGRIGGRRWRCHLSGRLNR